jgi:transposase InsO family protein
MQDRTEDGRRFRILTVIDEFTRRCLAIVVARHLNSDDVLDCLTHLLVSHGAPENVRSDNGPEFVAGHVRAWLGRIGVKTLFIELGKPLGERLLRELQLQTARRTPGEGTILDIIRSKGAHRALAMALQHHKAALLALLPAAGTGDGLAVSLSARLRFAPGQPSRWPPAAGF